MKNFVGRAHPRDKTRMRAKIDCKGNETPGSVLDLSKLGAKPLPVSRHSHLIWRRDSLQDRRNGPLDGDSPLEPQPKSRCIPGPVLQHGSQGRELLQDDPGNQIRELNYRASSTRRQPFKNTKERLRPNLPQSTVTSPEAHTATGDVNRNRPWPEKPQGNAWCCMS